MDKHSGLIKVSHETVHNFVSHETYQWLLIIVFVINLFKINDLCVFFIYNKELARNRLSVDNSLNTKVLTLLYLELSLVIHNLSHNSSYSR